MTIGIGTLIIVIILGLLGAAIYHVWNVYQTRFARRYNLEESHGLVLMAELAASQEKSAKKPAPAIQPASAKQPAPATKQAALTPSSGAFLRPSILDAATQLAYLSLKLELPDHEVLTQVDSGALFAKPLPIHTRLDFVVCHKRNFTPIAIIALQQTHTDDPQRERILQHLSKSGLRVVRWPAGKPPGRNKIRPQVLGTS